MYIFVAAILSYMRNNTSKSEANPVLLLYMYNTIHTITLEHVSFFLLKSISILPTNPRTAKICHSRSFLMSAVLLRAVRHRAFVDQIEGVQRHPFHWSPLIHDDLVPKSLTGWASENLVLGIFSIELEGLHYGHVPPRLRPGSIRLPVIQPPGVSTTSCDAAALWPLILHDPTSYDDIALEGLSLAPLLAAAIISKFSYFFLQNSLTNFSMVRTPTFWHLLT